MTDSTVDLFICSNIEVGLGVIAGSLSTLRPLLRFLSSHSRQTNYRQAGERTYQSDSIENLNQRAVAFNHSGGAKIPSPIPLSGLEPLPSGSDE